MVLCCSTERLEYVTRGKARRETDMHGEEEEWYSSDEEYAHVFPTCVLVMVFYDEVDWRKVSRVNRAVTDRSYGRGEESGKLNFQIIR